jgi:hypothetical protein
MQLISGNDSIYKNKACDTTENEDNHWFDKQQSIGVPQHAVLRFKVILVSIW